MLVSPDLVTDCLDLPSASSSPRQSLPYQPALCLAFPSFCLCPSIFSFRVPLNHFTLIQASLLLSHSPSPRSTGRPCVLPASPSPASHLHQVSLLQNKPLSSIKFSRRTCQL
ncbi:uncharacterized protein APUU_40401S [Aspergillus puulaauensis]|uniref:Uncharacterized protein n=1 Tax=Aspergillus puulaauensis TaxID=1220207 RepID=A0A7R7XMM3_9EURO|nr:uncharacterized protein APUU_40401S [Aspergillus puulaauensis]BCS23957.1 hypothetical protein APUU_40401S [Aspergillus puulaauensis]